MAVKYIKRYSNIISYQWNPNENQKDTTTHLLELPNLFIFFNIFIGV